MEAKPPLKYPHVHGFYNMAGGAEASIVLITLWAPNEPKGVSRLEIKTSRGPCELNEPHNWRYVLPSCRELEPRRGESRLPNKGH